MLKITLNEIKEFIQVSNGFILPLVNLPLEIKPINTYMKISNLDLYDGYTLIALFYNKNENYQFHLKEMQKNKYYDIHFTDGEFDIVIFDLTSLDIEYDLILRGQYSSLPKSAKVLITYHNPENIKVLIALHPEYYYQDVSNILNININTIKNCELLAPPDLLKETLEVNDSVSFLLEEAY